MNEACRFASRKFSSSGVSGFSEFCSVCQQSFRMVCVPDATDVARLVDCRNVLPNGDFASEGRFAATRPRWISLPECPMEYFVTHDFLQSAAFSGVI